METDPGTRLDRLLAGFERLAVAVSGGVDSMTLAWHAGAVLGARVAMYHAVSPAVPELATARVQAHAARAGWQLHLVDAGEMSDPAYLANPVDRCFHCKTDLYATLRRHTDWPLASGANLDDLGDYRPGLKAAAEHGVRHPLVEAGIDKRTVRALAHARGLDDLAELPAAPCLSSRIETGIAVTTGRLALVQALERLLESRLGPVTLRCRVRREGLVLELDPALLQTLPDDQQAGLLALARDLARRHGVLDPVRLAPYRMGSAFLRADSHA